MLWFEPEKSYISSPRNVVKNWKVYKRSYVIKEKSISFSLVLPWDQNSYNAWTPLNESQEPCPHSPAYGYSIMAKYTVERDQYLRSSRTWQQRIFSLSWRFWTYKGYFYTTWWFLWAINTSGSTNIGSATCGAGGQSPLKRPFLENGQATESFEVVGFEGETL
jgi:hypothetical protein